MDPESDANPVVQQLWRIFTYYALHADPDQPLSLKIPHFIKFCKDSQIISKKLTGTLIELEIAKLTREKRGKHADYSPHASLNFADFLELIELLAPKVYNKVPFSVAVRKLLLENIFILSGRRVPIVDMSSLDDRESMELLKSKELSNSITNIFKYYAHKAELRRTHEVANKSITRGQGIANNRNAVTNKSAIPIPVSPETKEALKSLRDLWGFEEYAEFCHDFNLKSTALLTGIQVGDVFLTVVPLDNTLKTIKGLNFDQFCKVLLCMALVAYRDISNPKITSVCKLKELLLFMWKTINSSEKATKAVNSRSSGVASHAGSLNVYGSGLFAVQFLNLWQRDNFCNYTVAPPEQNIEDGVSAFQSIMALSGKVPDLENLQDDLGNLSDPEDEAVIEEEDKQNQTINKSEDENPFVITIDKINNLLLLKPEIAEYLYLEICKEGI